MPTLTVLQPDDRVPVDRFGPWLAANQLQLNIIELWHQQVPAADRCGDGLLVLGGRDNALDVAASPWLPALRQLLRRAAAHQLPILGICLGHQILGDTFGGTITLADPTGGEEGPAQLRWQRAATGDPVLGVVANTVATVADTAADTPATVAESHHDTVSALPPGAVLLASTDTCPNQAFRLGSALGVQFHPEASPELMAEWAAGDGGDGPAMLARMRACDVAVAAVGRSIAQAFAQQVHRYHQVTRTCAG